MGPSKRAPESGCFAQARSEPQIITLFSGWNRLTTDDHGEMNGNPLEGFFSAETLFVSEYRLRLDGKSLSHRFSAQLSGNQWASLCVDSTSVENGRPKEGTFPRGSLESRILREIGDNWREEILVVNHSLKPRTSQLEISFVCPLGDRELAEEMKREFSGPRRGVSPKITWKEGLPEFKFSRFLGRRTRTPVLELARIDRKNTVHDGDRVTRSVFLRLQGDPAIQKVRVRHRRILGHGEVSLRLRLRLPAKDKARIRLCWSPEIDGFKAPRGRLDPMKPIPREPTKLRFSTPSIETANSTFNLILSQAAVDLDSLTLPLASSEQRPNEDQSRFDGITAGIPRYIGMFSRDTLITVWQASFLAPDLLEPALTRVAAYRGVRKDDWRDEELWRLPHERRLGPNAATGQSNRALYYGDVTAGPFWIIALANAFHWSGDLDLLKRQSDALEDCCNWITWRLKKGGGYIYYAPALPDSKNANLNQGWKDSADAIVDHEGRVRHPPLALAEIQSNAYLALNFAANLYGVQEQHRKARQLRQIAEDLKIRFTRDFWMPQERFLALALDKNGEQLTTIASNAGHCLFSGILNDSSARDVVQRLLSPELFSGWGIRTLSSKNPSFDPFSYHRGSVWPVENATIAYGMSRLGFRKEANQIIGAQLGVASFFQHMRLPEVFSGHERSTEAPIPGLYPYANLLQAWSVSSISLHLQSILGIEPDALNRTLWIDPCLPDWVPWIEVRGLVLGKSRVDLKFWRDSSGETQYQVDKNEGAIQIQAKEKRIA